MILSGDEIQNAIAQGEIVIDPFDPRNLGSNSYDFRLGSRCKIYTSDCLDPLVPNPVEEFEIGSEGIVLNPGQLYLFNTAEEMGSNRYVPIIRGRSSTGRMGLFIDVTSDLIDIGSINQWTLQLAPILPIRVRPGMLIGQVTFWAVQGKIETYSGKYDKYPSPMESLMFIDPEDAESSNAA